MYVGYFIYYLITTCIVHVSFTQGLPDRPLIPLALVVFKAIQHRVALSLHDTPSQVNQYGLCKVNQLYVDLIITGTLVGTLSLMSMYSVLV